MKKTYLLILYLLFVINNNFQAQSYSVWFTTPTNGSTVANFYSPELISVDVGFNAT